MHCCIALLWLGPVEAISVCKGTIPGTSFPVKAGGGIPGLDWRHQDVDTIRAYGSLLTVFASKTISRDSRKLPRCRFIAGISHPGSFLEGHFVRAPSQNVRPL